MAKKYLLHRITDEDAQYVAEDTRTRYGDIKDGNCYCLVNKDNGKVFRDDGRMLIYKATGIHRGETDEDKRRFLEAIEACAYFRGYANVNEIKFKTPKIAELLYELEDHEIEIQDNCDECRIVCSPGVLQNREVTEYVEASANAYDALFGLQRNLPTLALFVNENFSAQHQERNHEETEHDEELPF